MAQKRTARTVHGDGVTTVEFLDSDGNAASRIDIDYASISKAVSGPLMGYGAIQLIQQSYAADDTPAAKLKAATNKLKTLYEGTWIPGSRDVEAQTPSILLAIMEVTGKDLDTVTTKYEAMGKSEKMKLAKDSRIVIARKKIDAERTKLRVKALTKDAASAAPLEF